MRLASGWLTPQRRAIPRPQLDHATLDASALVVDGNDERRGAQRMYLRRERFDLLRGFIVATEQDDATHVGMHEHHALRLGEPPRQLALGERVPLAERAGEAPGDAAHRVGAIHAYVEVHIEQGPILEAAGEALAVVEAMKMENVLRAARDGTIKVLHAKAGDSLRVDQKILEFA